MIFCASTNVRSCRITEASAGRQFAGPRRRNRKGGIVQQIHIVGIVLEIAVEPDRIGFDFADPVDGSGCRSQEQVNLRQFRVGLRLALLQPVHSPEHLRRMRRMSGRDDRFDHRKRRGRAGLRVDEGGLLLPCADHAGIDHAADRPQPVRKAE